MELFNKFKNNDFTNIRQLINGYYLGKYTTLDEMKEYFQEINNFVKDDDLISKLLDDKAITIFKIEDTHETVSPILDYSSNYNEYLSPILLTITEKEYIKTLLEQPLFRALLGDTLSNKLDKSLQDINSLNFKDIFVYRDSLNRNDNLEIIDNIKLLTKSMIKKQSIDFVNTTANGKYISKDVHMYRFLYTPANKLWQIITYNKEDKRVILCTISKISDIKINENNTKGLETHELIEKKKVKRPLKMKINEIFNSLERVFLAFSDYEVETYYKNNNHFIEVYYYEFEERKVLRDVLALGDAVVLEKDSALYDEIYSIVSIM